MLRRLELDVVQPEPAEPGPLERVADGGPDAEEMLVRGREVAFVRELVLSAAVSLRANLRFAFLAQCFPPDVTPAHVDAAKAEAGKQEGRGMLRSAEDTWRLLQEHLVVPRVVPATDEDGRLAFAWICRSRNKSNPARWRAENPRDAARALDTVDEWLKRAREKLETQGLVRGGERWPRTQGERA
jgi:hypothetical protein